MQSPDDIANVVVAVHNGIPTLVKDVGQVTLGIAPRLGQFEIDKQNDAVEGVIKLRTGEKTQDVLRGVEAKTQELNTSILPKDVKLVPFYDRSDLVHETVVTVENNLLRGMLLVVAILIFFLYDVRSGLIVAITIPLSLLFAFACLDLQGASANLLSIGAIDFGILVDAAVIMVENIYRRLAESDERPGDMMRIIREAAAEVDRPLFYSVVVIVVSFLPIYVLSGPSGVLFKPMADTMIFALIGSLIVTLTLLPVLCSWLMRSGVRERRNAIFERLRSGYVRGLITASGARSEPSPHRRCSCSPRYCYSRTSAPSSCRISMKAPCGSARRCLTPSPSMNWRRSSRKSVRSLRRFRK